MRSVRLIPSRFKKNIGGKMEVKDKRRIDGDGNALAVEERKQEWEIIPRHEWVLIRKLTKEEMKTEGGVVIPGADFFLNAGTDKSQRGQVVAAGEKTGLKPGDLVIFTNYALKFEDLEELTGDKSLHLVREEEVYAVVRQKPCP
jgi:co-chaperonin GroES (HSP10)